MTERLRTGQPGSAPPHDGPPYDGYRPAKRRRPLRKLLITLAVLIGLLVAADFGLAAAAEYQVSEKVQQQLRLREAPEVQIHGFPFTLQALRGDYPHVTVSADGVPVDEKIRDLGVLAELYHVRLALSDVLSGNAGKATIDSVDGTVKVRSSDISRLLGIRDLEITPASMSYVLSPRSESTVGNDDPGVPDDGDASPKVDPAERDDKTAGVRLSGTQNIAGTRTTVAAFGVISLVGDQVRIEPKKLEFSSATFKVGLPDAIEQSLLQRFAVTLDPGGLPFDVTPTAVGAEQGAVSLGGTVSDVRLDSAGQ